MTDQIRARFLRRQRDNALRLASESDILSVDACPSPDDAPSRFLCSLHCRGVVGGPTDAAEQEAVFRFGVRFGDDHLRESPNTFRLATWLAPHDVWHPNIMPPYICLGRLTPGIELVDVIYQCFEIVTYRNWTADDCLNSPAAQWARHRQDAFPVDRRPLKRSAHLNACSEG